jgi:hypothetical protein
MKQRRLNKKLNMKTRNLLITLGVAALTTANVMAGDLALSPRASDHQANTIPGTNTDPNLTAAIPRGISPRLAESKVTIVSGKETKTSPALLCSQKMSGTPKMVNACAEHPGADMPCCSVAANK